MSATQRFPAIYIPHGGGPCFFMDPPAQAPHTWDGMATYLRGIDASVGTRPKAILVISAHWECARPTVNSGARPGMLFDYHGFPEHTYRLDYPAAGSPALAGRVRALLDSAGIDSGDDATRGYDHGVFVPLLLTYPAADVPVLQLSLQIGLDPAAHLAIGRALAALRDEGVLIVGSGMSYHNLREFFSAEAQAIEASTQFDAALTTALGQAGPARDAPLIDWKRMPGALACHPRAEHLLPLMVVAGAAGTDVGRRAFNDRMFGKAVSAFIWLTPRGCAASAGRPCYNRPFGAVRRHFFPRNWSFPCPPRSFRRSTSARSIPAPTSAMATGRRPPMPDSCSRSIRAPTR